MHHALQRRHTLALQQRTFWLHYAWLYSCCFQSNNPRYADPQTEVCLPKYLGQGAGGQQKRLCTLQQVRQRNKASVFCSRYRVALCLTPQKNCFDEYNKQQMQLGNLTSDL